MNNFYKTFLLCALLPMVLASCTTKKLIPSQPISPVNTIEKPTLLSSSNSPMPFSNENYAKFSTYHWENREHIDIGAGGTLVEKDGCLLIQTGDTLLVPLLPHEKTAWNESTKTLTYFGREIKLGEKIFGGGSYHVEPSKPAVQYILKAKPECLAGRKLMVLRS